MLHRNTLRWSSVEVSFQITSVNVSLISKSDAVKFVITNLGTLPDVLNGHVGNLVPTENSVLSSVTNFRTRIAENRSSF